MRSRAFWMFSMELAKERRRKPSPYSPKAVLSGTAFGEYGEGFLRLSFANSIENIQKALERIEKAVRRLPVRVAVS